MLALSLEANEVIELLHGSYNEVIAIAPSAYSCLGLKRYGKGMRFRAYKGRFREALSGARELTVFSSYKAIDYVEAALTKDLELVETPAGPGPRHWYLAIKCELRQLDSSEPASFECVPREAYFRPSPPPARPFYYLLEAAVHASRWFLGEELVERAVSLAIEAYRLGDELDRLAANKVLRYLMDRL